jgi:hypothetical protein
MPLRDHFRPPLDDVRSWDELHAMWPATIVRRLNEVLPELYFAGPGVYLGSLYEVDIATYRDTHLGLNGLDGSGGGVAVATYAPPKPTLTFEPRLPDQDIYEVRIYTNRRNRSLVAAIEIISPSNKGRPESRGAFVSKVTNLLRNNVCVSIVDVVSTSNFNLYSKLLNFIEGKDPALGDEPPPIYTATLRTRQENNRLMIDSWYHPLSLSQPLPTLPICLSENLAISLDLESSYEETCRTLRIR